MILTSSWENTPSRYVYNYKANKNALNNTHRSKCSMAGHAHLNIYGDQPDIIGVVETSSCALRIRYQISIKCDIDLNQLIVCKL